MKEQEKQQQQKEEEEEEQKTQSPPSTMHSPPPGPRHHNPNTQSPPSTTHSPPPGPRYHSHNPNTQSPPSTMHSPPPGPRHHNHNPNTQSPPSLDSPPESISSDQTSHSHKFSPTEHNPPPVDLPSPAAAKVGPRAADGFAGDVEELKVGGGRRPRPNLSIVNRAKRENSVKRALLGFRICGFVFCLVSFSVLAADRDQGWALDSFYRYKEFRYCMSVNVIGFVYSGFQMFDLAYQLSTGKSNSRYHLRHYLDFAIDQMLTYFLMSASSSAAVRVDDWQSNWGADKFPEMARASVALSFLAFVSLAFSSIISGYTLCTLKSM